MHEAFNEKNVQGKNTKNAHKKNIVSKISEDPMSQSIQKENSREITQEMMEMMSNIVEDDCALYYFVY